MRIPMVDLERLDDELKVIVQKWQALGGEKAALRYADQIYFDHHKKAGAAWRNATRSLRRSSCSR